MSEFRKLEDMHGITPRERQILDAHESGAEPHEIAASMGVRCRYITNVISRFSVTAFDPWKADAKAGSAALLAAIARAHPERITI